MSSDDTTEQFLDTVDEDGEPKTAGSITLATGAKWGKLAMTMIGSLIVGWALGAIAIIRGTVNFFVEMYPADATPREMLRTDPEGGVIDALASFASDLITTILGVPETLLSSAVEESSTWVTSTFTGELAVLAFPAGVAVVMGGLYVAAQGVEVLR